MFIKNPLALFFTLLCCFGTAFAANTAPPSRAVTIGVFSLYPPFVYNNAIGFDINLMQAICTQEALQCTFVNGTMEELLGDLSKPQGKLDIAISAISITKERSKTLAFVGPYYQSTMSFVANEDMPTAITLAQLKGKTIGVEKSTIFYTYLVNYFGNDDNIKVYSSEGDVLEALHDEDVDAIVMDTPVAEYWQTKSNCKLKIVSAPIKIPGDFGYGMVIRKNNPALGAILNQGLQTIESNKTYARLVDTYFSGQTLACVKYNLS